MPKKLKEKRTAGKHRVPLAEEVRMQCVDWDQFQVEHAENISEGGIFIKTNQPLSPGTTFKLAILVGGEEITGSAQVLWTKEFPESEGRTSGMGARFLELNPLGRAKIRALILEKAKE